MGKKGSPPKPQLLLTQLDPNADQAAKQAAGDAKTNEVRRQRTLASSVGDPSVAPTSAPSLSAPGNNKSTTLGGGSPAGA